MTILTKNKHAEISVTFKAVEQSHLDTILSWLDEPHVQEFWDNSNAHREDIQNFIDGRKTPSHYFDGIFDYWIGFLDDVPFCFLLTSEYEVNSDLPELHQQQLSKTGKTLGVDFCIGNKRYLGKGLAATTLHQFTQFIAKEVESQTKRFFIDPSISNPRAIHVYKKAGFVQMGKFKVEEGVFKGDLSVLLVMDVV